MKDRMFRQKPYVRCYNCILTERFKCFQCMNDLVANMMSKTGCKSSDSHQDQNFHNKVSKNACHLRSKSSTKTQQFDVQNKYQIWMKSVFKKATNLRSQSQQVKCKKWPRKFIIMSNQNRPFHNTPKFENWQRKLLDRIKKRSKIEGTNTNNKVKHMKTTSIKQNLYFEDSLIKNSKK